MTEVDFSDHDSAEMWFEKQTPEIRSLIASRAALRMFANFRVSMSGSPDHLDLSLLRCTLISARRAIVRPADVDWATAVHFARYAANFAARAAASSVLATNQSALDTARSAISALRAADSPRSAASSAFSVPSAFASATLWDSANLESLYKEPLWAGHDVPPALAESHGTILKAFSDDTKWVFWERFYEGVWNGTFDEWDLALEVIKIDEPIWEKGVDAVAAEIEKIEARLKSNVAIIEANQPERDIAKYRPDNVVHLFKNAHQVRASLELSAETLNEHLDLFQKMACWNEPIPLFEPLREMPAALTRAAEILAAGNQSKKSEEALKDEVSKLRALLASVEAELKSAKAEIEELKKKPWWKSSKVIAGGSVIGAIVSTAWMISGDEIGPDKRWDMLSEYWEKVFPREELVPEPLHYQLPDSWET